MNIEEKIEKRKDNNVYFLKTLYLIKKNFPTSYLFYSIMYCFKYIGIIVNSRIIEMNLNKDYISINKYLSNLLIFGKSFSPIFNNYQLISTLGAFILLIFSLFTIFCFIYMKIKYEKITSLIEEKMYKTNEKLEEFLCKIISYIFMTIIFFHQYILEYYLFGFYGFIYYQNGLFSKNGQFSDIYIESLHPDLYDYFSSNNHLPIFIMNLIVILVIFAIFFAFLLLNTTKGLFLMHGMYIGNMKYLVMKLIILSFQPIFGITNFYSEKYKIIIGFIINIIIIVFCIISFWSCLHQFGYYPNKVSNLSLFLEFFVFFTSISEIIIFLVGNKNSYIFFFIKLFIEIINAFFFTQLFIYMKDKHNLNLFAKNLFSKTMTNVSKGELYYYMRIYLEYQKNKSNNYLKIFRILIAHVKMCKKIDCPGHTLIPMNYIKSSFSPTTVKDKKISSDKNLLLKDDKNNKVIKIENDSDTDDSDEEKNLCNTNQEEKNIINKDDGKNEDKNIKNYQDTIFLDENKLSDKQLQIIFEQEIINKIDFLYKSKKFSLLEDYIFIHLQYLYVMKKNYSLLLYYIGKYSKSDIKWSFLTKYFLYEYKKLILSFFFNKTNIDNIDQSINKYRKDNLFMSAIIDYFLFSAILNNLIINSCYQIKMLFSFQKDLHVPIFIKTFNHSKTKKFFNTGEELKNDIDKILLFLRIHLNIIKQKGISAELSYIISNFFIFTQNKIPNDLRKIINPVFDINSISNKLESGYKFLNLVHPLILSLAKNNTFTISYFSSVINNRLGYYHYELKNKDFHDKLFPGIRFIKQHELLMKQFLFFENNSHIKKDTFLKSKQGYLIGIKLTAKKYPNFYDDFLMIIGIDFNDNLFFSDINKNYNRYSFLLDENLDFISQTKNFYEDFEFNITMLKEIKTNFFEFFCVDKNSFNEKLKKKNENLFKKTVNNVYNLKKEDDAFTVFKTISYEKAYKLRDISKIESVKNEHIVIRDKISKDKIIKMIPEFSKLIEEYGLDCEWYQHLENLNERLSIKEIKKEEDDLTEYSKNMVSFGLNINAIKNYKNTLITNNSSTNNLINCKNNNKDNKESTINFLNSNKNKIVNNNSDSRCSFSSLSIMTKKNNNEEDYPKKILENNEDHSIKIILDRNFDVIYNLRKLGTIYFYIVDLYEKTLYKSDYNNTTISSPKHKFSLSNKNINKEESLKLINNNIVQDNNNQTDNNSKFLKAKTLFAYKNTKNKNLENQITNILIEEPSFDRNDKDIKTVKSWASEKNNINIQKHLIKEAERIFNNKDILIEDNKNNKISPNTEEVKKPSNITFNNRSSNKFSRLNKRNETRKRNKDKIDIDNNSIPSNNDNNIPSNNNSYKYKNKDDDEEKMSFITKDKLEDYIKKSYMINHYFILIIFILFFITIIIITIKLILARTNFSLTSYLTNGMVFIQEIKADIYMGSIIALSQCYRTKAEDIPTGLASFFLELIIKSADLMTHLNAFEKQLKLTQNNNLFSNIMTYLYKNITITSLNADWSLKEEDSYLLKEINYFTYLLNEQSSQLPEMIKCNFEDNFYLILYNTTEEIYNLNNKEETSFYQRFLSYIINNVIYKISPLLNDIVEELVIIQVKTMDSYLTKIVIISTVMIIIIILNGFFILLKNRSDAKFIKKVFEYLYYYDQNQLQFEYEINYLEIVAKEFNIDNLIILENIKKTNDFYINLINSNNTKEMLLYNNTPDNINNNNENNNYKRGSLMDNLFKNNQTNNDSKFLENIINRYQKIGNELDQNSVSGSVLNNSMNNNSMMQLLNKKTNKKDGINKLKYDNKKQNKIISVQNNTPKNKKILKNGVNNNNLAGNDDEKIFKENEDTLELLKANNNMIPFSIKISIFISIFFSIIFLLSISINYIDIFKKRDIWEYAINLSMNYLEKVPKLVELGLSTYLTVILGSINKNNFYTREEYDNYQSKYISYFRNMKNYDNSELLSSNIKDSFFANELYDNYRIKKNIEFCENDSFFQKYFSKTKYWNQKLNENNRFCLNAALGGVIFYNKWISTLSDYFAYVEQMTIACVDENVKIDESGLDLEIDLILHELTYLYLDFEERVNTNITDARIKFFENENLIRMLRDMNVPLTLASGALYSATNEDMNNLNNYISNMELVFINLTYAIDFIYLCFLIFMMISNEKSKKILVFISKILKKS